MASIVRLLVDNYQELSAKRDPLVDSWLFMQTPVPVVLILVAYLYFVLSLGPKLMKNRPAFDLKHAMILYNLYQVMFSLWLCSNIVNARQLISHLVNHSCKNPSPNKEFQAFLSHCAWWYFFSKITELLDTVFFVLRKRQRQVSFLHVYHHSITMFGSWAYLKYLPGEQGMIIGFLNTLVHVVMYFYYFLAALGPKYQKYLWWKKYMTWMQLIQFGIMLLYLASVVVMDCKLPRALTYFFVTNVVIFMYLFGDYYRKAYMVKPKKGAINVEIQNNGICQHKNGVVHTGQIFENGEIIHENGKVSVRTKDATILSKEFNDKKKG